MVKKEEINYEVLYHPKVVKSDLPALRAADRHRIQKGIEQKIQADPFLFGKPLRRSLFGARTLRCGDYRIVYVVKGSIVYITAILHRSIVYVEAQKRIV